MTTHARPFRCTQPGCQSRPFGDNAGVVRHLREVHMKPNHGRVVKSFKCPHRDCKRHQRPFSRKYNLGGHLRRVHQEGSIDGAEDDRDESHLSSESSGDDAEEINFNETEDGGHDGRKEDGQQHENPTNLVKGLHAELDRLKAAKEDAMKEKDDMIGKFDAEIKTLSDAIGVMEGRQLGVAKF